MIGFGRNCHRSIISAGDRRCNGSEKSRGTVPRKLDGTAPRKFKGTAPGISSRSRTGVYRTVERTTASTSRIRRMLSYQCFWGGGGVRYENFRGRRGDTCGERPTRRQSLRHRRTEYQETLVGTERPLIQAYFTQRRVPTWLYTSYTTGGARLYGDSLPLCAASGRLPLEQGQRNRPDWHGVIRYTDGLIRRLTGAVSG